MLHMLIGHLRKRKLKDETREQNQICTAEEMPWRISLFFAGMHIRDKRWQHLIDTPTKSKHPAVFVYGKRDEYFDYARDGFGHKPQEEYYENPLIMMHEQSHEFPTAQPRANQIYDNIIDQIMYHCGGRLDSAVPSPPSIGAVGKQDLQALIGPQRPPPLRAN